MEKRSAETKAREGERLPVNGEVALPRKIERLEAIFANITQLPDISRNDRPPTVVVVDVVVVLVAVVVVEDDRNSIWLARLEIGRATYPWMLLPPKGRGRKESLESDREHLEK